MISVLINGKTEYKDRLQAAAGAAAGVLRQRDRVSVSFGFVSAAKIHGVNLKFRGVDKATDVLSFPNLPLKTPLTAKAAAVSAKAWQAETDGDGGVFLGDIIVCKSIALKQAKEYGHGDEREIIYLFIHGLLHLFGFDHENETDKKLMRETEERIIRVMGT